MRRLIDWASDPKSGTLGAYAFVAVVLVTSWAAVTLPILALFILKGVLA